MTKIKNVLCIVTQGELSSPAFERAVNVAEKNKARLKLVETIERIVPDFEVSKHRTSLTNVEDEIIGLREERLRSLVEPFRRDLGIDITTRVLVGVPFLTVIRDVIDAGHDLVVKTTHSAEWRQALFGSNDMQLLRKCPCPVWMLKPESKKTNRRVLAAVDVFDHRFPDESREETALSRQILDFAYSVAKWDGAELHVAHAWHPHVEQMMRQRFLRIPEAEIESYVDGVRQQHDVAVRRLIREFSPAPVKGARNSVEPKVHMMKGLAKKEIPALASDLDVDLLVMGTVGRTGIPGYIIGNTAESILNQIDCSVVALKPHGFQSPVTSDY